MEMMLTALKVLQMKLQRPEMRKMSFRTNKVHQRSLRNRRRQPLRLLTVRPRRISLRRHWTRPRTLPMISSRLLPRRVQLTLKKSKSSERSWSYWSQEPDNLLMCHRLETQLRERIAEPTLTLRPIS